MIFFLNDGRSIYPREGGKSITSALKWGHTRTGVYRRRQNVCLGSTPSSMASWMRRDGRGGVHVGGVRTRT